MGAEARERLEGRLAGARLEVNEGVVTEIWDLADAAIEEARRGVAKSGARMIIGLAQDLFAAQAALEDAREEIEALDKARTEAFDEGLREGMEAFTAEAQESVEVARRETFEEAAGVVANLAERSEEKWSELVLTAKEGERWPGGDIEHHQARAFWLRYAELDIRALADSLPDTGWRDRLPTADEVEAHDGHWVSLSKVEGAHWDLWVERSGEVVGISTGTNFECWEGRSLARWRPVTRDLFSAAWPKDDPDA